MKELITTARFQITGRGDVFILSLKDNGLTLKDVKSLGQQFTIRGYEGEWVLRGIEMMDRGLDDCCDDVGFLMQKKGVNNENNRSL